MITLTEELSGISIGYATVQKVSIGSELIYDASKQLTSFPEVTMTTTSTSSSWTPTQVVNSGSTLHWEVTGAVTASSDLDVPTFDFSAHGEKVITITSADDLGGLQEIDLSLNQLTSFDATGLSGLQYLDLYGNQLTSFDATGLTGLQTLYLHNNQLTSFDATGLANLQYLYLYNNLLTTVSINALLDQLITIGNTSGVQLLLQNQTGGGCGNPAKIATLDAIWDQVYVDTCTPSYTLTITNGTGDGAYVENTVVEIVADAPAEGYQFKEWTGDVQYLASITSSITNVTMPAGDISVTATYELIPAETVTIGGEEYETVTIGTQTWLKRNLHFDDSVGGIYAYDDNEANVATYGRLYTYEAAVRLANSIDGWHLPTEAEFITLRNYLGGGSAAGGKLKETGITHWNSPNTAATNEVGFNGLPGGLRYPTGLYSGLNISGNFRTKEGDDSYYRYFELRYNSGGINFNNNSPLMAYSIRLIKDTP